MQKGSRVVVTVVGRDRPGIVAGVTNTLAKFNANIVKARASSLLDIFMMVLVADVSKMTVDLGKLIWELKREGERTGLGISVETGETYKKEKRLIVLDMDGTVVDAEVIDELAKMVGTEDEAKEITKVAMEGKINFKEALNRRAKMLKDLPLKEMEKFREHIPLVSGAHDLISELKKAGFVTVLMTGSFDVIANEVGRKLGFDYVFSNRLLAKNGRLTGEVEGMVMGPESKLELLRNVAGKEGITLDECVAVGDGANDLLIIKGSGLGIGFNPKKVVKDEANALVNVKDLKVVLAFIGSGRIREEIKERL